MENNEERRKTLEEIRADMFIKEALEKKKEEERKAKASRSAEADRREVPRLQPEQRHAPHHTGWTPAESAWLSRSVSKQFPSLSEEQRELIIEERRGYNKQHAHLTPRVRGILFLANLPTLVAHITGVVVKVKNVQPVSALFTQLPPPARKISTSIFEWFRHHGLRSSLLENEYCILAAMKEIFDKANPCKTKNERIVANDRFKRAVPELLAMIRKGGVKK